MLLNDFYVMLEQHIFPRGAEVRIRIHREHDVFLGHFPGNPVTPGVVQMEIVKEILEHITGRELAMDQMRQCKFLAVHNPFETPELVIGITWEAGKELEIQARGSSPATTYFKLSASYREKRERDQPPGKGGADR